MTLRVLGEIIFRCRISSNMTQEALAEECDLSRTSILRVEKGIPVRKSTLDQIISVLKPPVFLYRISYDTAAVECRRVDMIRKLLSALRHGRRQRYSELLKQYEECGTARNDVDLQYDGFFKAIERMFGGEKTIFVERDLITALNLTFDTGLLIERIREIDSNLELGKQEVFQRCEKALTEGFEPHLLESEMLVLNAIAYCRYISGDLFMAEGFYRAMIEHLEKVGGMFLCEEYFLPTFYCNLALCCIKRDNFGEAAGIIRRIRQMDDIYEDDLLLAVIDKLEKVCSGTSALDRAAVPLIAFYRPGEFWPIFLSTKFLEGNLIEKLKKSEQGPIK